MNELIRKMYCSFELSKLLKEKGFPQEKEYASAMYDGDGELNLTYLGKTHCYFLHNACIAPTYDIVIRWLEEKGYYVETRRSLNTFLFKFMVFSEGYLKFESEYVIPSREDAMDVAIRRCLELL